MGLMHRWTMALLIASTTAMPACTSLGGSSAGAEGDYPAYSSDTALTEQADAVVMGDVVAEKSERISDIDYRVVSVAVIADQKLTYAPGDVVEVKLMTGNVAEPGPELALGTRYVLFLSIYDSVPASLLNPWQAFFEVRGDQIVSDPDNDITLSTELRQDFGLQ